MPSRDRAGRTLHRDAKALNGSDLMLDKLSQSRSAGRLPFHPEPPSAPVPAIVSAIVPASPQDRRRPQRQRRRTLLWSLALLVILPTALGSIYLARADAVRSPRQEVRRLQDLLGSQRGALRFVRDMQQEFDPIKQAEARHSLRGTLEAALPQAKTKLGNVRLCMGKDAPGWLVPNRKIASLERQVAEARAKPRKDEATASRGRETLGGLVANDEGSNVFAISLVLLAPGVVIGHAIRDDAL
jgi:hypothetical protein